MNPASVLPRLAAIFLATAALLHGKTIGLAPNGKFQIDEVLGDLWIDTINFHDPGLPPVRLEEYPWPGDYQISPDSKWILRIQKSGSGENIGFLYQVEPSGRVSQIVGFDDSLWAISDAHSRLKKNALYHTGITSAEWSKDSHLLTLVLRGSHVEKSGDGIECRISYDVSTHTFTHLD
jgi:hypothetical protein